MLFNLGFSMFTQEIDLLESKIALNEQALSRRFFDFYNY